MFKVNTKITRKREESQLHCSGMFIINFECYSSISIVYFEQVNVS